jgi:4-cresol dehydrogenase (hydroxylating)
MTSQDLSAALSLWRQRLGGDRVIEAAQFQNRYGLDTSGQSRVAPAALLAENRDDVCAALEIARRHRIPLYPISSGKNWGYGGGSPLVDGCVILDLSRMKRIVEMDRELGLVTLEPGVTQRDLREYLDRNELDFMVPTTGAGPNCSLVGNALERGYGITPYADHFGAVTALEAVLPDGRLYRSALAELKAQTADRAFKWGVGPYLDGLFAQWNLGIVTQMTIALAPRPERLEAFYFGIADDSQLEAAVLTVQRILREVGGVVGAINLMNARRVLAMTVPYPAGQAGSKGVLSEPAVLSLARRHQIRPWMGVGALYGSREVVLAARRVVRRLLRPIADRVVFMTPERSALLNRVFGAVPGLRSSRTAKALEALGQSLEIMAGEPGEMALRLAYWLKGTPSLSGSLDPARDGCGLIWYPPLVPMKPASVRDYVNMINEVCKAHSIEPLITLTSLTDRCFDSSVPLLFDRSDPREVGRATECFDALFDAGQKLGCVPYRLGIQAMAKVTDTPATFWDVVRTIKSAMDPDDILAPGRYTPRMPSAGNHA